MRIAFVITELEVGGAERCLVQLATGIDRARFEPLVISLKPRPSAGKDSLVAQLQAAEVSVRFLDRRSIWAFGDAYRQLTSLLEDVRPDIVQSFLFHANVLGAMAARHARVPKVVAGVRVADPRRRRAWTERWACRNVDRFVCVSEGVARHCRSFGYPKGKITVIPNGVDCRTFAEANPANLAQLGLPAGRRAIAFVGRLHAQKGLDDLLAVTPGLFEELPNHDLLLVGDGPQRRRLMRQAARLGVASRVHFAGYRTGIPGILAAVDLLVLPSLWEGMPNVVLEAMASGKPVVATRAEGVEEALGELAAEQCVPVGDGDKLAKKILHFAGNPQVARQVGEANQRRAGSEFSIQAMVERYEQLYLALS